MIKKLLLLSFLVSSFSVFAAAAGEMSEAKPMKRGDAEKGSKLVGTCVACHGVDGNSVVGQWPTLAGQRESYLFEQLEHIRDEERVIAVMKGLLNNYSDDDLRDMAAFYASQKTKVGQADETNLELGQQIYRAGNLASGVPACTGCHGPAGKGLESATIRKISKADPELGKQFQDLQKTKKRLEKTLSKKTKQQIARGEMPSIFTKDLSQKFN